MGGCLASHSPPPAVGQPKQQQDKGLAQILQEPVGTFIGEHASLSQGLSDNHSFGLTCGVLSTEPIGCAWMRENVFGFLKWFYSG